MINISVNEYNQMKQEIAELKKINKELEAKLKPNTNSYGPFYKNLFAGQGFSIHDIMPPCKELPGNYSDISSSTNSSVNSRDNSPEPKGKRIELKSDTVLVDNLLNLSDFNPEIYSNYNPNPNKVDSNVFDELFGMDTDKAFCTRPCVEQDNQIDKKELDSIKEKEAKELDEATELEDRLLIIWSSHHNKNIRNLLTTMHNVIWKDSGWKPIFLSDVIESKNVKLYYRKALLIVHPDRCNLRSEKIRLRAKSIFETLNESYQEFLKKEGV